MCERGVPQVSNWCTLTIVAVDAFEFRKGGLKCEIRERLGFTLNPSYPEVYVCLRDVYTVYIKLSVTSIIPISGRSLRHV